jgi:hypothetical protein
MLNDENRTGTFVADGHSPFGANIVGTGAMVISGGGNRVPDTSSTLALFALALAGMAVLTRRR